ncbi:MAG: hypothetical protein QW351_02790 [Candidatus Caldarchaeum sp.]
MAGHSNNPMRGTRDVLRRLREPGILTAAASMATLTGVMVAVMSLNTVLMYSHHHSATDISTVVMIHAIGMYASPYLSANFPTRLAGRLSCWRVWW